jgi:outer membrane immunogenic protein
MKSLLRIVAALLALSVTGRASAADLAQFVPVGPGLYTDWNGFYVGAHLGGVLQDSDVSVYSGTVALKDTSFTGGGQIGVNFALWQSFMVGMEADISGALLHGTVGSSSSTGTFTQAQNDNKTDMYGTFRGRVGYILNNWLFYGTGGFAWADTHQVRTQLVGATGTAGTGTVESAYAVPTGWVAGVGVEWAFASNWTARVEYLHIDVGSSQSSVTASAFPNSGLRHDEDARIDTVRAALNYRFNWMGR